MKYDNVHWLHRALLCPHHHIIHYEPHLFQTLGNHGGPPSASQHHSWPRQPGSLAY